MNRIHRYSCSRTKCHSIINMGDVYTKHRLEKSCRWCFESTG